MSSAELDHIQHRVIVPEQRTADYDTEHQQQSVSSSLSCFLQPTPCARFVSWHLAPGPAPILAANLGDSEYDVSYAARNGVPAPHELPLPRGRAPDLPGHLNPAMVEAQDLAYAQPYMATDWYSEMLQARQAAHSVRVAAISVQLA